MAGGSGEEVESMMAKVALECGGDISASQEDILARSSFLGGHVLEEPPLTQQDHITICTLPFTPSQSPALPDDGSQDDTRIKPPRNRKPRVCTRKVRGARIRTPTPSPKQQQQQDADPLYRAVLMIPTAAAAAAAPSTSPKLNPVEDFLALARHRGLF